MQVISNVTENGLVEVYVAWDWEGDSREEIGDGELCILHFTIAGDASYGDRSDLSVENLTASSAELELLAVDSTGGEAIVRIRLPADIDGNDVVDAVDVQLAINGALGLSAQLDGDINCDGNVDAVDVQLAINAVLGLEIPVCTF